MPVIGGSTFNGTDRTACSFTFSAITLGNGPGLSATVQWGSESGIYTHTIPCVVVPSDPGQGYPDGSIDCSLTTDLSDLVGNTVYWKGTATFTDTSTCNTGEISNSVFPPPSNIKVMLNYGGDPNTIKILFPCAPGGRGVGVHFGATDSYGNTGPGSQIDNELALATLDLTDLGLTTVHFQTFREAVVSSDYIFNTSDAYSTSINPGVDGATVTWDTTFDATDPTFGYNSSVEEFIPNFLASGTSTTPTSHSVILSDLSLITSYTGFASVTPTGSDPTRNFEISSPFQTFTTIAAPPPAEFLQKPVAPPAELSPDFHQEEFQLALESDKSGRLDSGTNSDGLGGSVAASNLTSSRYTNSDDLMNNILR